MQDELLTGGNVSKVFRVGNTVRRDIKAESPNIHRLLQHLEKKGFVFSPRFLGIDEQGREILSFIEGEVGNYPLKEYMWSDEALIGIAKMQRLYHDAVQDFPLDSSWQRLDNAPQHAEVMCHNDFAIYNIIFKDKKPVGIIDFDVAGPGPRLWDIAYTLYTCVPLSRFHLGEDGEKIFYDTSLHAERRRARVKLFLEAYGEKVPEDYFEMILLRLDGLCKTMTGKAKEGHRAFQKMIEEGHLLHYQEDIAFIRRHANDWNIAT
ncbi:phosphotransferase [Brevibacillus choshinensis]|uniref:phosphotransferase n=1 Tax=Brevibacillus choshinensis TaxID=54911 RepID=UPI002E2096E2|nr:phosphotransferase [Brevibacillus choshinensis]